jgi:hypothetical protein
MKPHHWEAGADFVRLPQPALPAISPGSFILLAVGQSPAATADHVIGLQVLYRLAFQQAVAVVLPSLPERDLLAVWN